MAEGDRPQGGAPGADGRPAASGLRVLRGGGARRARPDAGPSSPTEVTRRLAALERRVERALSTAGRGDAQDGEVVRTVFDGALSAWAAARRGPLRELLETVRPDALRAALPGLEERAVERVVEALYTWWWRVETVGLDRLPPEGRVLVVANRGSALVPYEALVLQAALRRLGRETHALLLDEWAVRAPLLGRLLGRAGVLHTVAAARRSLARESAVVSFPEARRSAAKPFAERYRLARFGSGAFARLAIEMRVPIVPVAVIGSEEIHPVLARLDGPGRLLGLPTLPITPTFPWLGLAGLVPLPTKWTLLVGEPLDVAARHAAAEARRPTAVARLGEQVRERLQALILEGLRRRRALFGR